MNSFSKKYLSRKFLFAAALVVAGVLIDLKTDRGLSSNLKELFLYFGGIFVAGNIAHRAVDAYKDKTQTSLSEELVAHKQLQENQYTQLVNFVNSSVAGQNEVIKKLVEKK